MKTFDSWNQIWCLRGDVAPRCAPPRNRNLKTAKPCSPGAPPAAKVALPIIKGDQPCHLIFLWTMLARSSGWIAPGIKGLRHFESANCSAMKTKCSFAPRPSLSLRKGILASEQFCTDSRAPVSKGSTSGASFMPWPRHPTIKESYPVFRSFYGRYLSEVPQAAKAGCYQAAHNAPRSCCPRVRLRGLRACKNQNFFPEAGCCRPN